MKLDVFSAIIAVALSALIGWAISSFNYADSDYRIVVSLGCVVSMIATLLPLMALRMPTTSRVLALVRITSIIFVFLFLINHIIFGVCYFSITAYIITTIFILLIYAILLKKLIDTSREV